MDAHLRFLLRSFTAEPTEENAMKLAIAMTRSQPQISVRDKPLTFEEIMKFPVHDGMRTVEGVVRVDFGSLWRYTSGGSMIDLEVYFDVVSEALAGQLLQNLETEVIDVEPGEIFLVHVKGDIEVECDCGGCTVCFDTHCTPDCSTGEGIPCPARP